MSGNVLEWVEDMYYFDNLRAIRRGSFGGELKHVRTSFRNCQRLGYFARDIGFRVVRSLLKVDLRCCILRLPCLEKFAYTSIATFYILWASCESIIHSQL